MLINNEQGVTLVEAIAVFVLTTIAFLIIYPVLFGGIKSYENVHAQALIRDEADYVMAQILNELYPIPANKVAYLEDKKALEIREDTSAPYLIECDSDGNIKIGSTILNESSFDFIGSTFEEVDSNDNYAKIYEINLVIQHRSFPHQKPLTLISEIQLIASTEGS